MDDGPVEIALSLIIPYAAYLAADAEKASGVIAVVACGLLISRQSSRLFSPRVRLQSIAVWDALEFLLNGLVFVLIGLQLPYVLAGIHGTSRLSLLAYGLAFSAVLVLLRLAWMYPAARVAWWVRTRFVGQVYQKPQANQVFVIGWTGMRGVVALAAAYSLPITLTDGRPFPQRSFIIFLTFSLILVTLVFQGLSLPWLIRVLGARRSTTACAKKAKPDICCCRPLSHSSTTGKARPPMRASITSTMTYSISMNTRSRRSIRAVPMEVFPTRDRPT